MARPQSQSHPECQSQDPSLCSTLSPRLHRHRQYTEVPGGFLCPHEPRVACSVWLLTSSWFFRATVTQHRPRGARPGNVWELWEGGNVGVVARPVLECTPSRLSQHPWGGDPGKAHSEVKDRYVHLPGSFRRPRNSSASLLGGPPIHRLPTVYIMVSSFLKFFEAHERHLDSQPGPLGDRR